MDTKTKFCKHCGTQIPEDAVICTSCGRQVEELKQTESSSIIINNSNANVNTNAVIPGLKLCNKWVALVLAIFLGFLGAHKFYEGKIGMGILYLFTGGLFFVGMIIDIIAILAKPVHYYA